MPPSDPAHDDGEPIPGAGVGDCPDETSAHSSETSDSADGRPIVRQPRIRRAMHPRTRNALAWAWVMAASLTLALLMRTFLVAAFFIPSESMEPALKVGDRLLGEPSPGDVVVFHTPPNMRPSQTAELVKRVVAVEGQMVEASDSQLLIDGQRVGEPYLPPDTYTRDFGPILVPTDHVFVMGDNRISSQDSRYFGTVPESEIVGRAFALFWPLNRLGGL